MDLTKERTLVLFKPDLVQRQIIGEVLQRFEKKGLKVVGMKLVHPNRELVEQHYVDEEDYHIGVGEKAIKQAKARGEEVTETPLEVGRRIREWNMTYLTCGPVLAIVFEGPHVIELVRRMLGSPNPRTADIGTIRSDYTPDSYLLADMQGRTTRTLVHASDSTENAEKEISLWFDEDELFEYDTAIENILFDTGWSDE